MKKALTKVHSLLTSLESSRIPATHLFVTVLALVAVRGFLEDISDNHLAIGKTIFADFYLQTTAFHMSVFATFALLLSWGTRTSMRKILPLLTVAFVVMLFAPIIDLIVSKGEGMNMMYFFMDQKDELWSRFISFFGSYENGGVTPGQRVQVALVVLGAGLYCGYKKAGVLRTIAVMFLAYVITFLYAMVPVLSALISQKFGVEFHFSNTTTLYFYVTVLILESIGICAMLAPNIVKALWKDLRIPRLLHCMLLMLLGGVLAWRAGMSQWTTESLFAVPLIVTSVIAAFLASIITNNMEDKVIDQLTNRHRPHVTGAIPEKMYEQIAWWLIVIALGLAMLVGFRTTALIGLFIGSFWIYSMRPFRAKRIPVLSKGFMAISLTILVVLGFHLAGAAVVNFPLRLQICLFLALTLTFNFIDLKDTPGDKLAGIPTVPVLIGDAMAKPVISILVLCGYLLLVLGFADWKLLPVALIAALIQATFLNRTTYDERPIFIVSLILLLGLIVYIAFAGELAVFSPAPAAPL